MEDGELKVEIGKMDLCVVIVVVGINLWLSHERKGIETLVERIYKQDKLYSLYT